MKTYIALIWIATLTSLLFAGPPLVPSTSAGSLVFRPVIPVAVPRVVVSPVILPPPPPQMGMAGSLISVAPPLPVSPPSLAAQEKLELSLTCPLPSAVVAGADAAVVEGLLSSSFFTNAELQKATGGCRLFLDNLAHLSGSDPKADLLRGENTFAAAAAILQNGTGLKLPLDGRRVAIPEQFMDSLIEAFQKEYTDAATVNTRLGRSAAPRPITGGNVGHMQDHLNYYDQFQSDFQKQMGVDPKSLKLAIVAHDIGKGFLDEFIDTYVAFRTQKDFVKRYVMAHEFHSIANIPKVVKEVLLSRGIDIESEHGRELLFGISLQTMEMIRFHNSVLVVDRMSERYPDLKPEEIEAILKAWWPENYRQFAADFKEIGLLPEYGTGPLGAIPAVLNLADRATLASPAEPAKLGMQRYSLLGATLDLFEESMIKPATGNIPLIKAQALELQRYLLNPEVNPLDLAPVREAQNYNTRMLDLGKQFIQMNQADRLKNLHLSAEEMPLTAAERVSRIDLERAKILSRDAALSAPERKAELERLASASVKQYLYYQTRENIWYRVEGSDPSNGVTQVWNGNTWKTTKDGGHPVQHLMNLAIQDGAWPKI